MSHDGQCKKDTGRKCRVFFFAVKNLDVEILDSKLWYMRPNTKPADEADAIDHLIEAWRRVRPDLDPEPLALVGRVLVLAQYLERSVNAALKRHGLTLGQFDILATLRRHGVKGGLTPGQLLRSVMLSSGGMTARLDQLARTGLIVRRPNPQDRRTVVVELTPKGRQIIDAATATRFANARECLPLLEQSAQHDLVRWLRRWLLQMCRTASSPAATPG